MASPAALAPPDPNDESASDTLDDEAIGPLLTELPDIDGDEESAQELPDPLELDALEDDEPDDDEPLDADFGEHSDELLALAEEQSDDDDAGPADLDASEGLVELPEPAADDDGEGLADGWSALDEALAGPEPEDDAEERLGEPERLPLAATVGDEARPPLAQPMWTASVALVMEPCLALASANGAVVAASSDLFWFLPGERAPMRLDAGARRVHAVALSPSSPDTALCSTADGRLLRRCRMAHAAQELTGHRSALERPRGEVLDLCRPGAPLSPLPAAPLLARSTDGILLASDDEGGSFRRVALEPVRLLTASGLPIAALGVSGRLFFSDDGGTGFRSVELEPIAAELAGERRPVLAADGALVALGAHAVGLLVSGDGGRSFERIAGTRGVLALTAAHVAGSPIAFAALEDEGTASTSIVRVEVATGRAECIARFEEDAEVDSAWVSRLVWEPARGELWVAGGFGVKVLSAP